jgi:hypothetical protein
MISLLDGFHAKDVYRSGINRAHIVLLPKKEGVLDPGSFRPVSLQKCSMKFVCKLMGS